jgi:hypothetical protein
MTDAPSRRRWARHFVYRTERTATTWKFRVALVVVAVLLLWASRGWWTVSIGRSLVCEADGAHSDALLVENFDVDYLVFERAADLRRAGVAPRVIVPVETDAGTSRPNDVAMGTTEVLIRIARLGQVDFVPIRIVEPISLNAARDVLAFLEREHIRSVTVISPLFRSERSARVYRSTLGPAGVTVSCEPARSEYRLDTWVHSWHGIEDVVEQWIKLQYYRWYVLPFVARRNLGHH